MKTALNHISITMFAVLLGTVMIGCGESNKAQKPKTAEKEQKPTYEDTLEAQKDSLNIDSEYDLETVDRKHQKEFMENLSKIEDKYGTQWDFCTCVVKNDSINRAIMNPAVSDAQMDILFERSEAIDKKCQAFLVQSPNQTPEERYKHEKKVKDCLKKAGVK
jgi:hypothetical protein